MPLKTDRRLLAEYAVLLLILVGVPLACAWLGGYDEVLRDVFTIVPQTDDWQSRPEMLWNCRRPFRWWAFFLVGGVGSAMVAPFVVRFLSSLRRVSNSNTQTPKNSNTVHSFPLWGWLGVAVMLLGWILAWNRFEFVAPVQRFTYIPQWMGLIVALNALVYRRTGRSPLTHETKSYLTLFPVSAAFWWFFEYLNRYVWNWFYVGVPGISACEYAVFATLCFASVLPGVTAVAAWLNTFAAFRDANYAGMAKVNVRSRTSMTVMTALTLVGLVGIVFIPQLTYPLLWISPLMGFVLLQVWWREPSVLDQLAEGNWGTVFRFAVAALVCGLAWETWNYYSLAKWIYSVPYAHRFLVWEMPIMGFAGYLPFGLECAALAAWVDAGFVACMGHGTHGTHETHATGAAVFERLLRATARRHDLVCVPVSDPAESELPDVGLVELEDPESGELVLVDTSSKAVRGAFAAKAETEREDLRTFFLKTGIDTMNVQTDRPYINEVRGLFKRRARKR